MDEREERTSSQILKSEMTSSLSHSRHLSFPLLSAHSPQTWSNKQSSLHTLFLFVLQKKSNRESTHHLPQLPLPLPQRQRNSLCLHAHSTAATSFLALHPKGKPADLRPRSQIARYPRTRQYRGPRNRALSKFVSGLSLLNGQRRWRWWG